MLLHTSHRLYLCLDRFCLFPGAAPSQAAPTASDTSKKGPEVQSVADPKDVEQALDSVGDAVENAVPDPRGASTGLAPTSPVSANAKDSKQELQGTVCIVDFAKSGHNFFSTTIMTDRNYSKCSVQYSLPTMKTSRKYDPTTPRPHNIKMIAQYQNLTTSKMPTVVLARTSELPAVSWAIVSAGCNSFADYLFRSPSANTKHTCKHDVCRCIWGKSLADVSLVLVSCQRCDTLCTLSVGIVQLSSLPLMLLLLDMERMAARSTLA